MARSPTFKRKRLTELYASLPATKKYPGKEKVRGEVAAKLSQKILDKGNQRGDC
ncbi:hypothetical protein [Calderihabitans maritimus]|uniref:AbrB family transcriptional regulator n=1 Tax=Calderihabitans maritimus TaxID=1246530 RepID=A0A1Z5HNT1_9FIRM|nr:hypothetical protein [Calderihabitans maritimus]GAW90955.1 AbrB family transcriptional regulator [Calderihabitans maritimus]